MTTPRDIERCVDELEPEDEDDAFTVVINHETVNKDGEVVDKETEVFRFGTDEDAGGGEA